jgi:hypothetical protein
MKRMIAALVAALLTVALVASTAFAATSKSSIVGIWKVSLGPNYAQKPATATSAGVGFDFSTATASYVDLLTTTQGKSLLGDLTGKTITATFTVTASSDAAFVYGGDFCGSSDTFVRPYFKSNLKGAFAVTNYWWANPTHYTFVDGTTATITLTVPVATGNWSDWNGEPDSTVSAAFAQAVTNVGQIGLSFGGGCFFANGVGLSAGSASFVLTSYSVAP